MPRKMLKWTHDHVSVRDEPPWSSNNCTVLQQSSLFYSMPPEILEKIFNYLNPRDLVSIRELNVQRFTEISLAVRHADFSECNTVQMEDVAAFFTKDRVLHIREINFNNIFFVKNSTLEKYIVKCKHLRKLSVYESGLTYANIISIFAGCLELEELYWSIMEKAQAQSPRKEAPALKLKKLYLNVRKNINGSFLVVIDILERCATSVEICLNMSPFFTTSLPPCMGRKIFVGKLNRSNSCPVSIVFRNELQQCITVAAAAVKELVAVHSFAIRATNDFHRPEDPSSLLTSHSSFLQVLTEEDELNAIPSLPPSSVHALVLIMTGAKLCLESHIEMLKRVTGEKLKHLAVHNTTKPVLSPEMVEEEARKVWPCEHLVCKKQSELITKLTSTCLNIQVLNLSDLHFAEPFQFKALYHLTRLKILSLSACTLKTASSTCTSTLDCIEDVRLQMQMFEGFVLQCKNIERFSFFGCLICRLGPTDEQIMPISKWPKLTHLVISKVSTFRLCHFLSHVADSCPDFISLEIIEVGPPVCHFVPSVIQVLRKSKQLMFLRINHKEFNPVHSLFWKSVELARNLQGLCLSFCINTVVENKMITEALIKLPFFHLLHMTGPRIAANLTSQVNQIMNKNGVKNTRTEISLCGLASGPVECMAPHFPFLKSQGSIPSLQ